MWFLLPASHLEINRFPSPRLLLFPHLGDLRIFVCVPLTGLLKSPVNKTALDAWDCCELLCPGHGVWQSDVLSPHGEGDAARAPSTSLQTVRAER